MHSNNSNSTLSSSCWKVFLIYARCMIYLSCNLYTVFTEFQVRKITSKRTIFTWKNHSLNSLISVMSVQNAFFQLIFKITYSTSTEYHYSLSDCHTVSKLILKKLSLFTVLHYYSFVCTCRRAVSAVYTYFLNKLFY